MAPEENKKKKSRTFWHLTFGYNFSISNIGTRIQKMCPETTR